MLLATWWFRLCYWGCKYDFVYLFVCDTCGSCCWNSLGTAAFVYCTLNLNIAAVSLITFTAWIHFSERFHSVAIWKERRRNDVHTGDCSHDSSRLEAAQRRGHSGLISIEVVWWWGVDACWHAWQTKKVVVSLKSLKIVSTVDCCVCCPNKIEYRKKRRLEWSLDDTFDPNSRQLDLDLSVMSLRLSKNEPSKWIAGRK